MAYRIANQTLNASTIDILNVIRQNASLEYQSTVPAVTQVTDIPKVGEALVGHPACANQFINALVNRIALVRIQSARFNNPYAILKKGYLAYGETIEEIFVNIARVYEYSAEKAEAREFKRTLPDVRATFHVINWRAVYPITIQDDELSRAFLSETGVQDLIAKLVDSIYTAASYDEFLLFKYLLIKNLAAGKMAPVEISVASGLEPAAAAFRGYSNALTFMRSDLNPAGVKTTTPRERQVIFMDAMFNAQFDVDVLARAFNMNKADFMGRLFLIDSFTSFDNDRFAVIRANSDGLEEVTSTELALMADVKAVMVDEEFFQVYDNLEKFTEKYVASGLYWNYFLHTWKTVSVSPYANAITFVATSNKTDTPSALVFKVSAIETDASGITVVDLDLYSATGADDWTNLNYQFVQTSDATGKGIAIHKYGTIIFPNFIVGSALAAATSGTVGVNCSGEYYEATVALSTTTPGEGGAADTTTYLAVGDSITFSPPQA